MSRKSIVHRDLKPENVLLNSRREGVYDIRIADFGLATILTETLHPNEDQMDDGVVCGTAGYIAPEVLHGKCYTSKSDVFSVGSILYNILTLSNLFSGKNYTAIMAKNKACNLDNVNTKMKKCTPEARSLVKMLLVKDPSRRPTAL